jgi:hypothetical protein
VSRFVLEANSWRWQMSSSWIYKTTFFVTFRLVVQIQTSKFPSKFDSDGPYLYGTEVVTLSQFYLFRWKSSIQRAKPPYMHAWYKMTPKPQIWLIILLRRHTFMQKRFVYATSLGCVCVTTKKTTQSHLQRMTGRYVDCGSPATWSKPNMEQRP